MMHKRKGLIDPPTPAAARRLNMKFSKLVDLFEDDARKRRKWIEIDRAGYRPNRMVVILPALLHSATNHYGGNFKEWTHLPDLRIGVNWENLPDE
jgi:hypothetical protein